MTSIATQPTGPGAMALALEAHKPEGLWMGALKRLLRNRAAVVGLVIVLILILCAIFAPVIAPMGYEDQTLTDNNAVPQWIVTVFPTMQPYANISTNYVLGADDLGRDIFSRLIWGSRVSLAIAFVGPLTSLIIGILLGSIAGYYGGAVDSLLMRFVDLMYAFPSLLLIILMMAFFRANSTAMDQPGTFVYAMGKVDAAFGGMFFIFIGIGLTSWTGTARLIRGMVLSAREREYVLAAQSIGMNKAQILLRHILPNVMGPVIINETLAIPNYINTEAFLSFIGLGVQPPTPSWGSMIAEGAAGQVIQSYPNQAIFPALMLALAMYAFNFLGDGVRDALDPRTVRDS